MWQPLKSGVTSNVSYLVFWWYPNQRILRTIGSYVSNIVFSVELINKQLVRVKARAEYWVLGTFQQHYTIVALHYSVFKSKEL
jgi:hypothetical protein